MDVLRRELSRRLDSPIDKKRLELLNSRLGIEPDLVPGTMTRIGQKNAFEVTTKNHLFLLSYRTTVAFFELATWRYFITDEFYSVTTSRHLNAFIKGVSKKDVFKTSQETIDKLWSLVRINP